jgi:hypothetical protein
MMKLKCDFSKARIGDKVFSTRFGNGYISGCCTNLFCTFDGGVMAKYDFEGYRIKNNKHVGVVPELYWSEPEIIIPEPPKRMVKKEIECWTLVTPLFDSMAGMFESKEAASDAKDGKYRKELIPAKAKIEVEVQEE